jgi:aminoglycoside phosphotransferase (APT) family kinase protein
MSEAERGWPARAGAPDPEILGRALGRFLPGARVVRCEPIGASGASEVGRKEGGYARAWRIGALDAAGQAHDLVYRTAAADEFGHDRRADRAANLLLAYDTFADVPDHVRALDVGFEAPGDLRTIRGGGEPYLVTTFAEGTLYAEDLRRIAASELASAADLERCDALARWLAALHAGRVDDPPAWRRAIRDLLGHGEGIFGIVDAYPHDAPAAPAWRLEDLERRCLDWRWDLRRHPERLRRTHGDFHPFNIVFSTGARFTLLDASRGGKGDPADDVTALAVNYVFFGVQAPRAWRRGFAPLWRRFWERYLEAAGSRTVLESAPPFLAWRALVLGCPRFYPDLSAAARDALLGLAERALAAAPFDPRSAEALFP